MFELVYIKDAVTLRLNPARCNGCGMCLKVCPHAVFGLRDGKAYITDRDYCMECGACARNCQQNAIRVNSGEGCGCARGVIQNAWQSNETACGCAENASCA